VELHNYPPPPVHLLGTVIITSFSLSPIDKLKQIFLNLLSVLKLHTERVATAVTLKICIL
jgi:hypothetical protein